MKKEKRGPLNCFTVASITWSDGEKQKFQVAFGGILWQEKGGVSQMVQTEKP